MQKQINELDIQSDEKIQNLLNEIEVIHKSIKANGIEVREALKALGTEIKQKQDANR